MSNFYLDNQDLQFYLDYLDLAEPIKLQENNFADKENFSYASENIEDAVDSYRRCLTILGEIAGEFIAPRGEDIDREGADFNDGDVCYPKGTAESLDMLAKADLMGFTLPRKYGGINFPTVIYSMANEMVSRAEGGLMNLFGLQGIADTINAFASEELKDKYLPRFARGEITGAMVLTEPDAGSDLQNVQLRGYQNENGQWRLNGVKRFITNGCGDVLLVLARTEPDEKGGMGLSLLLAEKGPTVRVRRIEEKLGIHGSPTCELQFNDTPAYLIGERRRGLVSYVMPLMNGARVGIASQSIGIAQAAFNEARRYADARVQFGKKIADIPAVRDMLVEMEIMIEAARAITLDASLRMDYEVNLAKQLESGNFADSEMKKEINKKYRYYKRASAFATPCAKYYASEMAVTVTSDAIQILGGSGYMKDYPVERFFRDSRITTIYEGTSQLQVVAAIGGVMSGTADKIFDEYASKGEYEKPLAGLAKKLTKAREILHKCIDYVKKKNHRDYTDLYARNIVDIALDIYIGYIFLDQARISKKKHVIAKRFINRVLARARKEACFVTSGDMSTIKAFDTVVGPVVEE